MSFVDLFYSISFPLIQNQNVNKKIEKNTNMYLLINKTISVQNCKHYKKAFLFKIVLVEFAKFLFVINL